MSVLFPWHNCQQYNQLPTLHCAFEDSLQKHQEKKISRWQSFWKHKMDGFKYSEIGQFLGNLLKELKLKDQMVHCCFVNRFPVLCGLFNFLPLLQHGLQDLVWDSIDTLQIVWTVRWLWRAIHLRRHDKKNHSYFCFSSAFPVSLFVLRLLESSVLNAEVREGEILPPTIHRLMKGYNKYLRPFFDSKETADTCSNGNDNALRGNVFDSEHEGLTLQFCACMFFLTNIHWHIDIQMYCTCTL